MKTISTIKGIGIKNRSFKHDLRNVQVITGKNASGKTSVSDALKVALLGYHPELGKQPGRTITLAPDHAAGMDAAAVFNDGSALSRAFKRTATGASQKTFGTELAINPAQLHFKEFVNAKPTERHAILSSLMGQVDTESYRDSVVRKVAELGLGQFKFSLSAAAEGNPFSDLVTKVGEQGKFVKQSVDQARKTLATLTETTIPAPVDAQAVKQAQQAYNDAQRALGAAQQALASIRRRIPGTPLEAVLSAEELPPKPDTAKLAELERQLQESNVSLGTAKAELEAINRRIPTQAITEPDCTEPNDDEMAEAEMSESSWQAEVSATDQAIRNLTRQTDELQESITIIQQRGECPCCKSKGDHLNIALESLKASLSAASSERETAIQKNTIAKQELQSALQKIAVLIRNHEAWEAYRKAIANMPSDDEFQNANDRHQAASNTIARLTMEITMLKSDIANYQAAEQRMQRIADQNRIAANVPTESEIKDAEEALSKAESAATESEESMRKLNESRAAYDQAVADQQRILDLRKEADTNEAIAKNLQAFKAWLQEQEREATALAMAPVLKISDIFLHGVVDGKLAIREHLLGIQRGDQFIPLELLSGMEMTAVAAACQAAMATNSELKLIIVDELGTMLDAPAMRFFQNCEAAVESGVIDQAILIDPHNRYAPEATIVIE